MDGLFQKYLCLVDFQPVINICGDMSSVMHVLHMYSTEK